MIPSRSKHSFIKLWISIDDIPDTSLNALNLLTTVYIFRMIQLSFRLVYRMHKKINSFIFPNPKPQRKVSYQNWAIRDFFLCMFFAFKWIIIKIYPNYFTNFFFFLQNIFLQFYLYSISKYTVFFRVIKLHRILSIIHFFTRVFENYSVRQDISQYFWILYYTVLHNFKCSVIEYFRISVTYKLLLCLRFTGSRKLMQCYRVSLMVPHQVCTYKTRWIGWFKCNP